MIGSDLNGKRVALQLTVQKHLDGSLTVEGQGLSMTNPYSRTAYDIKPDYDSTTNMTTIRVWTADGYVGAVQAPGNINSAVDVSFFIPDLLDLVNPASAPAHNEP